MRFFVFIIWLTFSGLTTAVETIPDETLTVSPENMKNVQLIEKLYHSSSKESLVRIDVLINGKKTQSLKTTVMAMGYSLTSEINFDIDLDKTPDLAINTGRGRGGEGVHYWLFQNKKQIYKDLGEFPRLEHDKFLGHNRLYSLVSSSGKFQSIRNEYLFANNSIKTISTIGFVPCEDGAYYDLYYFTKTTGRNQMLESPKTIRLPALEAENCMNGLGACPTLAGPATAASSSSTTPK